MPAASGDGRPAVPTPSGLAPVTPPGTIEERLVVVETQTSLNRLRLHELATVVERLRVDQLRTTSALANLGRELVRLEWHP